MPRALALRDLGILAATLGLWWADAALRAEGGVLAAAVAIAAGAATALSGYLAHEWGHLLGAHLSRSAVSLPDSPLSVFLFRFDTGRNGRSQFLAMSLGGFVASALVAALLLGVLPMHALSTWVALFLTALGLLATAILEVPPFWRVFRGAPLPRGGPAYVTNGR
jgi:hypothetical protein